MNINYDTTAEQDFIIESYRKYLNRVDGQNLNDRQTARRIFEEGLQRIQNDLAVMDSEGLRSAYKTAAPAVRAQIDTLLGR